MRAVIICSGEIKNYEYILSFITPDDTVICADGGYDHAVKMGIIPNIVLGDMDSVKGDYTSVRFEKFPVEKNWTDSELAVNYVIENGFSEAVLFGCTGTRADHSLSNIFLLKYLEKNNVSAVIINDKNMIYMPPHGIKIKGKKDDIISVIPIGGQVTGYTTKGLYYSADDMVLEFGKTLGNSNSMLSDECEVSWKTGEAIVIKTHD